MPQNFNVPVANPLRGLNDLSGPIQQLGIKKKLGEAAELIEANDVQGLASFVMQNPEVREHVISTQKHLNESTQQARVDALRRIVAGENIEAVLGDTERAITSQGGTTGELQEFRDSGATDEEVRRKALQGLAFYDPQGAAAYAKANDAQSKLGKLIADREALAAKSPKSPLLKRYDTAIEKQAANADLTAGEQEFNALIKDMSDPEQKKARRIKAGLLPRETMDKTFMVAGVPYRWNPESKQAERVQIAGEPGEETEVITPQSVGEDKGVVAAGEAAGKQRRDQQDQLHLVGKV